MDAPPLSLPCLAGITLLLLMAGATGCFAGIQTRTPAAADTLTLADTGPLPFDTTGAGHGEPPHPLVSDLSDHWLAGDTVITATLTAMADERPERRGVVNGDLPVAPRIEIHVWGKDTSDDGTLRSFPIPLAPCPFQLRLYTDTAARGAPVWQSSAAPGALACPPMQPARNGGVAWAWWPVADIVGDSLPSRRYHFGYTVTLADGRTLRYRSGEPFLITRAAPPTHNWASLAFQTRTQVTGQSPRQLRTWTTVTNTGARAVGIVEGGCPYLVRLWRPVDAGESLVWRSEYRQTSQRGEPSVSHRCTRQVYARRELMPGDTTTFSLYVPLAEILADSLPDGSYRVSTELRLINDSLPRRSRDITYYLSAGRVTLRRAPDPEPSVRRWGPIRVEAATRLVRGPTRDADSVRTFVLVTNAGADTSEYFVRRGNPLTVRVFRTAADRDRRPYPKPAYTIEGAPSWGMNHRFALAPGQKWLFENGAAARDLRHRVGSGRLYFLALLLGPNEILSAGDVLVSSPKGGW